jgi:hypothetical protein
MSPGAQIQSAVEKAFASVHTTKPVVVASALGPHEGGPPLASIVAWPKNTPAPHWHVVTCGLSASTVIEGYPSLGDFELSLKVTRAPTDATLPAWVSPFLQAVALDAFRDERPLSQDFVEFPPAAHDPRPGAGVLFDDAEAPQGLKLRQLLMVSRADLQRLRSESNPAERRTLALELFPGGISDLARASVVAPEPPRANRAPAAAQPRLAPVFAPFTTLAITKGAPMKLAIGPTEAATFAQAVRAAVGAGRIDVTGGGWTVMLTVESPARSATWGTTLAVYLTVDLAKQVADALDDRGRDGPAQRWAGLPDLELRVGAVSQAPAPSATAQAPAPQPLLARLKKFFGA